MNWDEYKVTKLDFIYQEKLRTVMDRVGLGDNYEKFAELIGDPNDQKRFWIVDLTKPRVRNIIDALVGPNKDTIWEMLLIRHEERENERTRV